MQQPVKYFHKRLNSTNIYASQQLAKMTSRMPFWIRTDEQFAGKGQGNKSWISEPGQNLTGTLALFPDQFQASAQFALSQVFALAGASFLELFIEDVRIKWPNDLYAGNKKIGGILIETAIIGQVIDHAILGIGINVNQDTFPGDIPNPVSIKMITGLEYDLGEMETLFLESFRNQYALIENASFDKINSLYINKLYALEEWKSFSTGDQLLQAKITGVNEYGHLQLVTRTGTIRSFAYQEIEYLI
jgi:BirA family transcriptional regulator, biotin operon repressor / biotin---[acetyl-CoA-carboxylase] ligase